MFVYSDMKCFGHLVLYKEISLPFGGHKCPPISF